MGEKLIAIVAGMVAAVIGLVIFEGINNLVYPLPAGFNYNNSEMLKSFHFNAPVISKIITVFGYSFSGVAGGFVASKFDKTSDQWVPLIVGALLFVQYSYNFYTIPHPVIIIMASLVLIVPSAWLGYLLFAKYLKPLSGK